jgi:type II secretory pathway component PulF
MMYNILIQPLVKLTEIIYLAIHFVTGSYGFSLFVLSIISAIFIYLLNRMLEKYPKREKKIQGILMPQIARINRESTGIEKHERLTARYKRYS